MARTERQIAEFMAYYSTAPKEERTWALNHLARQEGKSPAEIRAIYEKFNGNVNLRKGAKAPEEFIGSIQKALREGYSEPQIITMYGTSSTIVQRARKLMKDQEPDEQMSDEKKPTSFPSEAYPGQIGDEPKYDERELEFEKHIDELEARRETLRPETPRTNEDFETEAATGKSGVWYALLAQLEEFAVGTFGKGTVFDSGAASSEKKIARLGVLTPDRKKVQITIEELGE